MMNFSEAELWFVIGAILEGGRHCVAPSEENIIVISSYGPHVPVRYT